MSQKRDIRRPIGQRFAAIGFPVLTNQGANVKPMRKLLATLIAQTLRLDMTVMDPPPWPEHPDAPEERSEPIEDSISPDSDT